MYFLIAIGVVLQAAFIMTESKCKYLAAVILKGLASLCFVTLGLYCYRASDFSVIVVVGLVFGMVGDILLNLRYLFEKIGQKIFLVGILIFLIGHIMYLVALVGEATKPIIPIAIGVVLAAILLVWIFSKITAAKAFKIFGVFYVGAVTIMAVVAVWNAVMAATTTNMIFAVGGLLFLVSDVILIFNTFTGSTKFSMRVANLSLYYIGQILIAVSLMFR